MEILFLWLVASIVIGVVAACRGRSGVGWFLFSLLLSPLFGFILVVCLPNLKAQRAADRRHNELIAAMRGGPLTIERKSSFHPIIEGWLSSRR